jgi:K+-sensing histidine kinase KdpD
VPIRKTALGARTAKDGNRKFDCILPAQSPNMRPVRLDLMRLVHFIGVLRRYQDKPSGYMIALLVLSLALGARELLDPYIKIPYVTLFPAIVVCSLVGGRLAGILAAIIGGIVAWYLWLPPRGTFSVEWPTAQLTIFLYVLTSTILLLLTRGLNETLKELEKERDLSAELFRELQHRTANNLQNVSALLRQNREAIRRDPSKATAVIDSAERRFEIMSRINRRLYSPELQEVEAAPFLEVLCRDVLASMGNENVSVFVNAPAIKLRREKAVLLSLIVAELMMNATKHAFVEGSAGFGRDPFGSKGNRVSPELCRRR